MKRVFITGIDGFTGRHLASYLEKRGFEIYGSSLKREDKNIFICDITDKKALLELLKEIKPNYVVHLAAISFAVQENIQNYYNVNVLGTTNLLEALNELKLQIKKVLIASSAVVYGQQNKKVLSEELCPNPLIHYGISKLASEQVSKSFFNNFPIVITRPFNYTGIFQEEHFLIPKIVSHFKRREKVIELGNLEIEREFNDIEFVCEAYRRILETEIESEIINIASQRGIKLKDIIKKMEEIAGYKIKIKVNSKFIRKNDIPSLTGSNRKLFSLLGEIKQKTLEETLKEMYEA